MRGLCEGSQGGGCGAGWVRRRVLCRHVGGHIWPWTDLGMGCHRGAREGRERWGLAPRCSICSVSSRGRRSGGVLWRCRRGSIVEGAEAARRYTRRDGRRGQHRPRVIVVRLRGNPGMAFSFGDLPLLDRQDLRDAGRRGGESRDAKNIAADRICAARGVGWAK